MSIFICNECNDVAFQRLMNSGLVLKLEEVRALYRIIKKEWINRDDDEAMAVASKISQFVYTHGETDAEIPT